MGTKAKRPKSGVTSAQFKVKERTVVGRGPWRGEERILIEDKLRKASASRGPNEQRSGKKKGGSYDRPFEIEKKPTKNEEVGLRLTGRN